MLGAEFLLTLALFPRQSPPPTIFLSVVLRYCLSACALTSSWEEGEWRCSFHTHTHTSPHSFSFRCRGQSHSSQVNTSVYSQQHPIVPNRAALNMYLSQLLSCALKKNKYTLRSLPLLFHSPFVVCMGLKVTEPRSWLIVSTACSLLMVIINKQNPLLLTSNQFTDCLIM